VTTWGAPVASEIMRPDVRRIVAVEAHRRRAGRCPRRIYSLGTGESFDIMPGDGGFVDVATGLRASTDNDTIRLSDGLGPVDLHLTGDVAFDGFDHGGDEPFSGRAGGGASVTIYERGQADYFQYAVVAEGDPALTAG
jgi:hypothetical protein